MKKHLVLGLSLLILVSQFNITKANPGDACTIDTNSGVCQIIGGHYECDCNTVGCGANERCIASGPALVGTCQTDLNCSIGPTEIDCIPIGACGGTSAGSNCFAGSRCIDVDSDGDGECSTDSTCSSGGGGGTTWNPGGTLVDIKELIRAFYNIVYPIAIAIGLAYIIKAGYTLGTSEGNPQLKKSGQEDLTSAAFGLVFVLLSMTLLRVIISSLIGDINF